MKSDRRAEALQQVNEQLEARVKDLQESLSQRDVTIANITDDMIKEKMLAAEQDEMLAVERKRVAQLTRSLEALSGMQAVDGKAVAHSPEQQQPTSGGGGVKLSSYVMDHMKQAKSKLTKSNT